MNVTEYLNKVAYVTSVEFMEGELSEVYKSKFDDSYIIHVGMEDDKKFFADHEITDELTHGVGFSPKDNKWYGWSHRAIYGFTIGSTCKKGDCHYRAANIEDEIEAAIAFWSDDVHTNLKAEDMGNGEIEVTWDYSNKIPNKSMRGNISGVGWHYKLPFGRGEWTAKTMEDAKQMAIDFNEGVS